MSWLRLADWFAVAGVGGLAAVLGVTQISDSWSGRHNLAEPGADASLISRGAYIAHLADCSACHSIPGKPPFAGGLPMALPIGTLYTPNITPDPEYGIGEWTLRDFDRVMRTGIARGHGMKPAYSVYPAMPYTSYASMPAEDIRALWAYFRFGVEPATVPNRKSDIMWPLSMRFPLTLWRWTFGPSAEPFDATNYEDATIARGAYFVDGPGHCGECHTPRGVGLQLKASTHSDGPLYLSGARVEAWYAPSLRSEGPGTLEEWSAEDIATFLKTGVNHHSTAFGSMTDVIEHSTQHMTDDDLLAVGKYLKTIGTPVGTSFQYDPATANALAAGNAVERGALVYLDNCAACHRPDGKGYAGVFPPLAGNSAVEASNALSLISAVLKGSTTPRTGSTPAKFTMPPFAWRLDDRQMAAVVSFIRSAWGNRAAPIDSKDVARARRDVAKMPHLPETLPLVDPRAAP